MLQIEVDPNYLPKIIGRQGLVVSKIRRDHDVQIVFPQKGESEENIITIIGYEKNTYEARDDIMKIVNELVNLNCRKMNYFYKIYKSQYLHSF